MRIQMRMEKFIETPNLPCSKVSLAIVDGRINKEIEDTLQKLDIRIIKTSPLDCTYEAISYHPDIMLHHLGNDLIVVAPNIENRMVYDLEQHGFRIIVGKKIVGARYPNNVAYNAARIGDYLVCNEKYTDEVVLQQTFLQGVEIINIKQGYSKCSIAIVAENAIITSDNGIYKALIKKPNLASPIECCLIEPGYIELVGMEHGFIGGASGLLSSNVLGFYGNICQHPDYAKIKKFINEYGRKTLNLCENVVMDLGTFIPLKEYSIVTK